MGRPILAQADRVVREDIDRPELGERGETNRGPHVVGEDQERAAKRNESAMQRDSVQRSTHAVLADPEMEVPARPCTGRKDPAAFYLRVVRRRQIR